MWTSCYHSWNAVVNAGVGLAALAMSDEDADAQRPMPQARKNLRHFFDALGREGGWDEGIGYWGYAMRYVLLLAEAARRLDDDQTLLHQRGMDADRAVPGVLHAQRPARDLRRQPRRAPGRDVLPAGAGTSSAAKSRGGWTPTASTAT